MKLIRNIFLITTALLGFASCEDMLDITPHDKLSDETAFSTIKDYNNAILGSYESLRGESYYGGFFMLIPDVLADNVIMNQAGRYSYKEWYSWTTASNTFGVEGFWSAGYNGILGANKVIEKLEKNPFKGTADTVQAKVILGEALAIRAMVHFDLVRMYGKDFTTASSTDLGVPYKTTSTVDLPARNTVKENYASIVADLVKAIPLLKTNGTTVNYRINEKSANGLLARVYLTMKDYKAAAAAATAAVKGDGSDVATRAKFGEIWTLNTGSDIMFKISITETDAQLLGNVYGQGQGTTAGRKAEYVASYSFFNAYSASDIRKTTYFAPGSYNGKTYNFIKKYDGRTTTTTKNKCDAIVLRTEEVYLTLAEAQYHNGEEGNALTNLNYVRAQRYSPYNAGTEAGQTLLDAILMERRLETAMEGQRFFDIKRLQQDVVRDNKGDEASGAGTPSPSFVYPFTSYRFQLPIPQGEILANPNMKQNDGYSN